MKSYSPHIKSALEILELLVSRLPINKSEFESDLDLQDATLMRLQVAGEQLIRVRQNYSDFYDSHSSESWHKLIGLRNIIAHGYLEIDVEKVWQTVTNDVPELIQELKQLTN